MKRYKVISVSEYAYTLEDETKKVQKISLQFYDVKPPQSGEYISFSEKLFDTKANEGVVHFNFGKLSEKYGKHITRENINDNIDEILVIERDGKKYYLKRFYG